MFDLRFNALAALAALTAVTAAVALCVVLATAFPGADSGSNSSGEPAGLMDSHWLGR